MFSIKALKKDRFKVVTETLEAVLDKEQVDQLIKDMQAFKQRYGNVGLEDFAAMRIEELL